MTESRDPEFDATMKAGWASWAADDRHAHAQMTGRTEIPIAPGGGPSAASDEPWYVALLWLILALLGAGGAALAVYAFITAYRVVGAG